MTGGVDACACLSDRELVEVRRGGFFAQDLVSGDVEEHEESLRIAASTQEPVTLRMVCEVGDEALAYVPSELGEPLLLAPIEDFYMCLAFQMVDVADFAHAAHP